MLTNRKAADAPVPDFAETRAVPTNLTIAHNELSVLHTLTHPIQTAADHLRPPPSETDPPFISNGRIAPTPLIRVPIPLELDMTTVLSIVMRATLFEVAEQHFWRGGFILVSRLHGRPARFFAIPCTAIRHRALQRRVHRLQRITVVDCDILVSPDVNAYRALINYMAFSSGLTFYYIEQRVRLIRTAIDVARVASIARQTD
ncbi:uncharacterized protein F5147DRAFT_769261 [Suillus discolor]|uniref:Uncharacterized protein n=1 Tax=Suillus discolor TaxID=1912936 RepID=A0A9P7FH43_9AGAM|nr:uncharacterized protein F5147DRAFT_769261 [Suillus discolor]KAG2115855.1 hypothetical protein F5147DRAFT_769261 [Suillus discolor]